MTLVLKKLFVTSFFLCSIIFWGLVLFPGTSAFAKDPQIVVKELASTQKSWNGARLPAYPVLCRSD